MPPVGMFVPEVCVTSTGGVGLGVSCCPRGWGGWKGSNSSGLFLTWNHLTWPGIVPGSKTGYRKPQLKVLWEKEPHIFPICLSWNRSLRRAGGVQVRAMGNEGARVRR